MIRRLTVSDPDEAGVRRRPTVRALAEAGVKPWFAVAAATGVKPRLAVAAATGVKPRLAVAAAAGLLSVLACQGPPPPPAPAPPPPAVVVRDETLALRRGPIGIQHRQEAHYVLVDVENGTAEDRLVVVDGKLCDATGRDLAPLYPDQMAVPAGERRAFALVASGVVEGATSAQVSVRSATPFHDEPPVIAAGVTTERDGDVLAATARFENRSARPVVATLVTAFYDAGGRLVARPFKLVELSPREHRALRFDGPATSVRATAFVYQYVK